MSDEYAPSQMAMDLEIKRALTEKITALEDYFKADVIFYFGAIQVGYVSFYRDLIEHLQDKAAHDTLVIFLNTPGGSVETVEQFVHINRHFYKNVYFVVPDYAMSAGTVFCLSGDKIYMDYSSALGPIDPQVYNEKQKMFVPALGYLDKMEDFIEKSRQGILTEAEFLLLRDQDMAFLQQCEQQKNLTIQLIKNWLVKYKANELTGRSQKEKLACAEKIAGKLGDNKVWCSHGRCIDINTLTTEIGINVDDYGAIAELREMIRSYNDLVISYVKRTGYTFFLHSRNYF